MFEQSILGLIKSLRLVRNDPAGEDRVIQSAMRDIEAEVKSTNDEIRGDAILKATYVRIFLLFRAEIYERLTVGCLRFR